MSLRQSLAVYRALTSSWAAVHGPSPDLRLALRWQQQGCLHAFCSWETPDAQQSIQDPQCAPSAHPCSQQHRLQQHAWQRQARLGVLLPHNATMAMLHSTSGPHLAAASQLVAFFSTAPEQPNKRATHGTGSAGQEKSRAPAPDAGACDEAIEDFRALKSRFDQLQKPSTLRPWHVVLVDGAKTVGSTTVAVVRYLATVPQKIQDFRQMPKDEWQRWKAKAWETVKHEAHHYWVRQLGRGSCAAASSTWHNGQKPTGVCQ